MANNSVSSQHDTPPSERHSRSSSNTTLVGQEEEVRPFVFTLPPPTHPIPSQTTSASVEAPQLDAAPTAAPKKKKKKPKKKNKTAAAAPETPVAPSVDLKTTVIDEDIHSYDPFESQLTHIDAIRRAVRQDTASYFARTNARMEKDAEERREADQQPKTP